MQGPGLAQTCDFRVPRAVLSPHSKPHSPPMLLLSRLSQNPLKKEKIGENTSIYFPQLPKELQSISLPSISVSP
jgi:hypothetical protein